MSLRALSSAPVAHLFPVAVVNTRGAQIQASVSNRSLQLERQSRALLSSAFFPGTNAIQASPGVCTTKKVISVATIRMAATSEVMEVIVKGAVGEPTKIGDCPFSQRVLLTLEEKKVPYEAKMIDTANKPEWFLEANPEGKVPVIKYEGKWIPDSDVIVGILEKDYPEPSLVAPEEVASVGSKLFPSFVKFLKSTDPSDGTEATLLSELKALNEDLAKIPGPFVAGEKVTAVDLSLAPKLYALRITLKHFKDWAIPEDLPNLHAYIQALEGLESFKKTASGEEFVIRGWSKALGRA